MGNFFKKLIPNNIAGIIGTVQALVPLVRELLIVTIRIVDIFAFAQGLEPLIHKVSTISASIESGVEKIKNMFLGV